MNYTQKSLDKLTHPLSEEAMREIVSSLIWDDEIDQAYQLTLIMCDWTESKYSYERLAFYWLGVRTALHSVTSGNRIRAIDLQLAILKGKQ